MGSHFITDALGQPALARLSVGASLLAMVVSDDAFILDVRGAFEYIASKLAPTGEGRTALSAAESC
ncbi:hypothetical protein D3C73_1641810 [compost metagenome]